MKLKGFDVVAAMLMITQVFCATCDLDQMALSCNAGAIELSFDESCLVNTTEIMLIAENRDQTEQHDCTITTSPFRIGQNETCSKIENGEQTTDVVLYRLIQDNYIIENVRTVACGVTQTFNVTSTLGLSGNKTVISGSGTYSAELNFFDKDSSNEITSLTIGDVVTGRLTLADELSNSLKLELVSCEYQAGGQTLVLITNGQVASALTSFLTVNSTSHNEISFGFRVFGLGDSKQAVFNCQLQVVESGLPSSTTASTTSDTLTTTTTTTSATTTTTTTTRTTTTTTTTTTVEQRNAVLVLNTRYIENVPLVVDGFGNSRQPSFKLEAETEVDKSCGVMFQDRMYIYGGLNQKTQISRVIGCSLRRVGTLPFEHTFGACATGQGEVYLCFNDDVDFNDAKKCRKSNEPEGNFELITDSNYGHGQTRIATSQDVLFAVGDAWNEHNKAETYNFETGSWTNVAPYPFSSYILFAPIVQSRNSFYVIGGWTAETDYSPVIARFSMETQSWTQAGNLNSGRYGHGAIELGDSFLVIGGDGTHPTEKCSFNANDTVECLSQEPDLENYRMYPELFLVPYDFC